MKRKQIIGAIVFIGVSALWVILFIYILPEPKPPKEGIPHNYYHPDVWAEDNVSDEYEKMWITNEGDTIWE